MMDNLKLSTNLNFMDVNYGAKQVKINGII
jgi:hypothetical protein